MTVELPVGEHVKAVCRDDPPTADLLLNAQRKLLEEGVVRVRPHGQNAYAPRLMLAAERRRKRRASGSETCSRSEAGSETWRSGNKGRAAYRTCVLGDSQGSVILNKLF